MKVFPFCWGIALLGLAQFLIVAAGVIDAAGQSGSLTLHKDIPAGYAIGLGNFIGTINGEDYNITGTVESAIAELQVKHPKYDWEANAAGLGNATTDDESSGTAAGSVVKRSTHMYPPLCIPVRGQSWSVSFRSEWYDCMVNMNRLGGRYILGPRICGRVSCVRESSVFLCNDRYDYIAPEMKWLVTYVAEVKNYCCPVQNSLVLPRCGGQMFDSDNYNIILRRDITRC